jgi:DNA polymerase elongation subunit (family B)
MQNIDNETIENFLVGKDPQPYIVAIEVPYYSNEASLIINHPERGKFIEKHKFRPFVWMKKDVGGIIYGGDRFKIKQAMAQYGVKIKELKADDETGYTPKRMANGFRYIASTDQSYSKLLEFFEKGGMKVYNDPNYTRMFQAFSPNEQFMIQTGKRLFKGLNDYDDLHRFQFDLETTGLIPEDSEIFQIGMSDNKGWNKILTTEGDNPQERRNSERLNIQEFFNELIRRRPDTVTGYYSENFDWDFIERRCHRLGVPMEDLAISLNGKDKIQRRPSTLKLGAKSEHYVQTYLWGFNIMDVSHSVRRAMEINSNIKAWGLKYITKFSKVHKNNRVYVPGKSIHSTWADKGTDYWFCDEDGSWGKIKEDTKLESNMEIVTGAYIVERYLLDDLWETDKVDTIYNQAAFLLSKILPTSYMRSSTMGTAGQWTLLLSTWSYENGLAIPDYAEKEDFTGGLSRLLETGYARRVIKVDFAALYPKTTLTWDIFPDLDISHVMKGLLAYIVSTRDEYKFLTGKYKEEGETLKEALKEFDANSPEYQAISAEIVKVSKLESDADKKQLPLKILANSFFGSYGAPHIFPWGDTPSAERITCMSRQHLRLMVRFFSERGFRALVLDTDGVNFAVPDSVDEYRYTPTCKHWKTEMYEGKGELYGVDAVVAEFNETHMKGWMGLDVDDICDATINFKRKNYANLINGKVKLVGNSIKSKKMPTYIEEFLNVGIPLLLEGKGYEFIQAYYKEVDKIFNYEIPIVKIASKGKVSETLEAYDRDCKTKTKSGSYKARKAHMEIVKDLNLTPNIGDVIYYVNIGASKSTGDVSVKTDKSTGKRTVEINCKYIAESMLEDNPDLTTEEYNVSRYITALNKKVEPLLVCFDREIRDGIIIETVKDRKLKDYVLKNRNSFTVNQCALVSNQPLEGDDQDSMEELMTMEDKEIKFWDSVDDITPYLMDEVTWDVTLSAYKERARVKRMDAILAQTSTLDYICRNLELGELNKIEQYGKVPNEILKFAYIDTDSKSFKSHAWESKLGDLDILFKYRDEAEVRERFYTKALLYLTRDTSRPAMSYWKEFKDYIRDVRFDGIDNNLKVQNYWIDVVINVSYDAFMQLDPDALFEYWLLCEEKYPYIRHISEQEQYRIATEQEAGGSHEIEMDEWGF